MIRSAPAPYPSWSGRRPDSQPAAPRAPRHRPSRRRHRRARRSAGVPRPRRRSAPPASCWAPGPRTGSSGSVGPLISKDGTGLASLLPIGRFRIYTVTGDLPSRSRADWSLKVGGLVDHPLRALLRRAASRCRPTDLTRDFQCVTGWRVPDVQWRGVQLSRPARPRRRAARSRRALRFTRSTARTPRASPSTQARRDDVIVAYQLRRRRRSPTMHGGPVRLYVAPMYGYKSLKWLDRIELTKRRRGGLLGSARLRRRRLGRPLQRPRRRCHLSGG